jgi:hypothetical protein
MADTDDLKKQIDDLNRRVASLGGDFFKDIDQAIASFGGGIKGAEAALKSLNKELNSLNTDVNYFYETLKKVTKELSSQTNFNKDIAKSYTKLSSLASQLKYDQDGISELNQKDLISIDKKLKIEQKSLETSIKNNEQRKDEILSILKSKSERDKLNENQLRALRKEYEQIKETNKEAEAFYTDPEFGLDALIKASAKRLKQEEEINKKLGLTGVLSKTIQNTLSKWGVDTSYFDDLNKKLREAAKNGESTSKVLQEELREGLKKALNDPLVQFTVGLKLVKSAINDIKKAFEAFKEYDTLFTNLARGLGMSTTQVRDMTIEAKHSREALGDNNYTAAQIAKSITDVNTQLGLSVSVSAATADEFAAMTNQMGLSAEEAANIYRLGKLNNSTLQDTNKTIAASIVAAQRQFGVQVNERQVFQEIGKLSAGITAKFQQNPDLIAKAVVQAKALGTNLEQVDKIGDSLLNWESSIENELKAELLTGKQINLEKARYAALTGDQVTLMNELSSQVGTLEEFQGMNVLAQKSLAEAFGLSRDELADMLKKQAVFNKLGDVSNMTAKQQLELATKLGYTGDESLMNNLKQQAAAETLAATWDSIKVSLAALLDGPFKLLVDGMSYLSKHAWIVHAAVGALATISLAKLIGGVVMLSRALFTALSEGAGLMSVLTGGLGLLALGAAVGVVAGYISDSQSAADAGIPQMANGGIIPATPNGTLVNVGEGGKPEAIVPLNSPTANNMFGGNSSVLESVLSQIEQHLSKPAPTPQFSLMVNQDRLGEVVGSTAVTGTNQYKSSYHLA